MKKENPQHSKRVRNLIGISALSAIVLLVATFAWFIGMQTVNVTSFDIEIAAADGLLLSFDGENFDTTVAISKETFNDTDTVYEGNTNNWAGRGLIPMSTAGKIDQTSSRLVLYEKASLTAVPEGTPGGLRLMVSEVQNKGDKEADGYVVFDLFVKNSSGNQYLKALDILGEEAIYLAPDSSVTVTEESAPDAGDGGVAGSGIENSVRVAFAQIGRVSALEELDAEVVTGITCTGDDNVTGICRDAQIWEPNDRNHETHAISYYATNCAARTGADVTKTDSYSGECEEVIDGIGYPTYVAQKVIGSGDNVNIYDGKAFNTYEANSEFVEEFEYFTDTMKLMRGRLRPEFMRLEPASITKVRVYIYLEGQDIDNYDFAAIGRKISVKFGFSKQQLYPGDSGYEGPALNQGAGPGASDTTAPEIKFLAGDGSYLENDEIEIALGTEGDLEDLLPEAEVTDNVDTNLTDADVTKAGTVNLAKAGTYYVLYSVEDAAENWGHRLLKVIVS